jgi:Flavoprotein
VVAPATFNTINKLAAGISDTLALRLLNETAGTGLPTIAVPFPNQMLARHPAFVTSIATLRLWGVRLIFNPERHQMPVPSQGESGQISCSPGQRSGKNSSICRIASLWPPPIFLLWRAAC